MCTDAKRLAALRVLLKRHRPAAAIVFVKGARPLARIAESLAGVVEEAAPLDYDLPLDARVTEPFPAGGADAPPAPPAARLGFVPAATSGGAMSWSAVAAGAAP